ncbi:HTH-type transcriptional regulator TdfR [Actinomadura rubteroloni]|uniref:HTH-type transcriptional regulator TdfR n=1 Tax=Actinomadura rubteroloni TaxID=1926885 RepID=A0A2P4UDM0_9ACTN|nr:LysR family transcriptional regulator [Actinomadura rubteroloni]POM23144.1 HTH-type transcriptional regulator TdfR [Actinomadura rubteroloni]
MLDLRKLDHLIAVAEEGGFTRAAERLHLTQQALSTSVRALEREVGVPLLDRQGGRVTVLPAGAALIEDARVLHGLARSAVRRARAVGRDEPETLRVGHTPAVTGEEVSVLVAAARAAHPGLRAESHQRYPDDLADDLTAGRLDLGLCRGMRAPHGLVRATLARHRLRVAVAADHPLAGRPAVALADLRDQRILVWGTPGRSSYTDFLLDQCRRAGFEPRHERSELQGTPPATAVIGTDAVAFVTLAPGPAADGRVRVLDLEPAVHAPLHALWPQHTTSPARTAFLDAAAG